MDSTWWWTGNPAWWRRWTRLGGGLEIPPGGSAAHPRFDLWWWRSTRLGAGLEILCKFFHTGGLEILCKFLQKALATLRGKVGLNLLTQLVPKTRFLHDV